ncbi:DUF3087 domain-containing protein [Pseudoalteromonas denitrificans]|uniref:DUF3087 domain-containing protein n=1 Tax=Pseudoalteromonas denitrificans DSM 6059 TaxID=1123010 RepID=A0A1I1E240_9GAMM|nr:DUF3087 domain-containing protein [Pseudoalteromonas denitrificans]SFB81241.1 Protein of unknown function [Pseudoalteromonas denitrificans DSM 6059]
MKLIEINKKRYRAHLNRIITACILSLAIGSLGIAQTLIALFPSSSGSHFHWNLIGVIITSLCLGFILIKYKNHSFMAEVAYVWDLKQALNKITRKMRKVRQGVERGDIPAMQALNFYYAGSRQLWHLDDNNITLDELTLWQADLNSQAKKYNIVLDVSQYDVQILSNLN